MRIRPLIPVSLAALLAYSAAARPVHAQAEPSAVCARAAGETLRVMVLDFDTDERHAALGKTLSQVLGAEAAGFAGLELVTEDEMSAVLDQAAVREMLGACDGAVCDIKLARAASADLLVTGTLAFAADGTVTLTAALVNPSAGLTVGRAVLPWTGPLDGLPRVARAAAQMLLQPEEARAPATIAVNAMPKGGHWTLDDTAQSPTAPASASVGAHTLDLGAPGMQTRQHGVVVLSGEALTVEAALEPVPAHQTWWFWTAVSGGAAAVVATGAALYQVTRGAPTSVAVTGPGPVGPEDVYAQP